MQGLRLRRFVTIGGVDRVYYTKAMIKCPSRLLQAKVVVYKKIPFMSHKPDKLLPLFASIQTNIHI